jgi:hypothetical protein
MCEEPFCEKRFVTREAMIEHFHTHYGLNSPDAEQKLEDMQKIGNPQRRASFNHQMQDSLMQSSEQYASSQPTFPQESGKEEHTLSSMDTREGIVELLTERNSCSYPHPPCLYSTEHDRGFPPQQITTYSNADTMIPHEYDEEYSGDLDSWSVSTKGTHSDQSAPAFNFDDWIQFD